MNKSLTAALSMVLLCTGCAGEKQGDVLNPENYRHYVEEFNAGDNELYKLGEFPNEKAWAFLSENIPLFDCPDKQLEQTYYFRWWTYRKHIRNTPDGYIITEFLPNVGWGGKHNSISCAAAHHFNEGRWLKDPKYLDQYARFWMKGGGSPRTYSFWPTEAYTQFTNVHPNDSLMRELFPLLEDNFAAWERENYDSTFAMFWQQDGRDGMEASVSGSYSEGGLGYRATINSYMYAEAAALGALAEKLGYKEKADRYESRAAEIKASIERLWDKDAQFYKVIPRGRDGSLSDARELHGYTPWYFSIPAPEKSVAWKFLMDSDHFYAPYGPTTAERCHPKYEIAYEGHECLWNGPSWPYATTVTLTALANLLNDYSQDYITREDYFELLKIYSNCHRITLEDGRTVPWIDENINPDNGDWIARTRLKTWENGTWSGGKGGVERGKDYNHSTFDDLVITGLMGVRVSPDTARLVVNPLVPEGAWDYFCLDRVPYKGKTLTILYDKDGSRYGRGKGFRIFVDGDLRWRSKTVEKAEVRL